MARGPGSSRAATSVYSIAPPRDKSGLAIDLTPQVGLFVAPWLDLVLGVNVVLRSGELYERRLEGHDVGARLGARFYWPRASRWQPYF